MNHSKLNAHQYRPLVFKSPLLFLIFILVSVGCTPSTQPEKTVADNQADTGQTPQQESTPVNNDLQNIEPEKENANSTENPDEAANSQTPPKNDDSESGNEEGLPTLKESLEDPVAEDKEVEEEPVEQVQTISIPKTWKRLGKKHEIWIDVKAKQVIAAGNICLNAGPLEMFACPRGTKEHESIISLNALGSQIHTALLALGVEPGHPVKWQDKYEPATGPVIQMDVIWSVDDQQKKRRAQELVKNVKTDSIMKENWVFGGSASFTDEETGQTYYYGDSGELVCLSNFSTATMDVPVKSSDANEGLLFIANTENIPEVNTKVYLVFKPEIKEK